MVDAKPEPADLNFPRRELFVHSLDFAVALSVRWQSEFLCAYTGTGRAIQLYLLMILSSW